MIVLDTNIVLDVLVFRDPATQPLQQALHSGQRRWIATPAMREELARVLAYPQIAARLVFHQRAADAVLAVEFDTRVFTWSTNADQGFAAGMARAKKQVLAAISEHVNLGGNHD